MNKYLLFGILLASISLMWSGAIIYSACCGQVQRELGSCPFLSCDWERFDGKCNSDSECCPGKQCSSFGYCELCY